MNFLKMSKKQAFIDYVEELIDATNENSHPVEMSEDARIYWEALKAKEETEKPLFTEGGKAIIKWMQDNKNDIPLIKSREIAEHLGVSSRGIAGSMRKLVSDGFVEKVSQDPIIYTLTEKGKNINISSLFD